MRPAYLPKGCDQQGRHPTGQRYPRSLTEAFNDADRAEWSDIPPCDANNHWLWWLAASVLCVLVVASPVIWEWVS